jgi:hypothetical protein
MAQTNFYIKYYKSSSIEKNIFFKWKKTIHKYQIKKKKFILFLF